MLLFLFPIENSQSVNFFIVTSLGCWFGVFFRESFQIQTDLPASLCELLRLSLNVGTTTSEEEAPLYIYSHHLKV